MNPPAERLPQLDGIRGLAVVSVLLLHCVIVPDAGFFAWVVKHTLSQGWIGVDIFFVLSGFLITSILLRGKEHVHYYRNFYARRFLRIFPLYYMVILLVIWVSPRLSFGSITPKWPFLLYVSNNWWLLNKYNLVSSPMPTLLGHAWSLAIEQQFYVLYPILVFRLNVKTLNVILWIIVCVSPVIRGFTYYLTIPNFTYFASFCRLDVLAMGSLVAVWWNTGRSVSNKMIERIRLVFFGAVFVIFLLWLTKQLDFRNVFFSTAGLSILDGAIAIILLLALLDKGGGLNKLLTYRHLVSLGKVSYGLYLIHIPVVLVIKDYTDLHLTTNSWGKTFAVATSSLVITMILAAISWVLYERPLLKMKKYFV